MKRYLILIPLLFLYSTLWAAEPVQLARMNPYIAGAQASAAGPTYVFPKNVTADGDFDTAGVDLASNIVTGDTITLPSQTITKLYLYINDVKTATECSIALYDNASTQTKIAGCHFTPANGWNSCDISYSASAGTFTIYSACNQTKKYQETDGTPDCDNYYQVVLYTQDMPASFTRVAAAGCFGMKVSY